VFEIDAFLRVEPRAEKEAPNRRSDHHYPGQVYPDRMPVRAGGFAICDNASPQHHHPVTLLAPVCPAAASYTRLR